MAYLQVIIAYCHTHLIMIRYWIVVHLTICVMKTIYLMNNPEIHKENRYITIPDGNRIKVTHVGTVKVGDYIDLHKLL